VVKDFEDIGNAVLSRITSKPSITDWGRLADNSLGTSPKPMTSAAFG